MSRKRTDQLCVYLDDYLFGPLQHIGNLYRSDNGTLSFSYEPEWLRREDGFNLDPELKFEDGEAFPVNRNFGIFTDSCPDRWGRKLMNRRAALEGNPGKLLTEWDYLLGVQDYTRMGALRFRYPEESVFQASELLSAPPITQLAELQYIARELSKEKHEDLDQVRQWLKVLVAPGASLGGARPKANILDKNGHLWIAKFPKENDYDDVAAWEMTLHHLAKEAGINVPPARLEKLGEHHTFLSKRFDRNAEKRLFFVSAMTVLKKVDNDDASYLELAEFLSMNGAPDTAKTSLEQLFRRVVFNAMTSNRDDHLRNHGFIKRPQGWDLSPAYDMNPSSKEEHQLAFDDSNLTVPDMDLIIESSVFYSLDEDRAAEIAHNVAATVSKWESVAKRYGLSALERAEKQASFNTFGFEAHPVCMAPR